MALAAVARKRTVAFGRELRFERRSMIENHNPSQLSPGADRRATRFPHLEGSATPDTGCCRALEGMGCDEGPLTSC
jgi:hypothetical protein